MRSAVQLLSATQKIPLYGIFFVSSYISENIEIVHVFPLDTGILLDFKIVTLLDLDSHKKF